MAIPFCSRFPETVPGKLTRLRTTVGERMVDCLFRVNITAIQLSEPRSCLIIAEGCSMTKSQCGGRTMGWGGDPFASTTYTIRCNTKSTPTSKLLSTDLPQTMDQAKILSPAYSDQSNADPVLHSGQARASEAHPTFPYWRSSGLWDVLTHPLLTLLDGCFQGCAEDVCPCVFEHQAGKFRAHYRKIQRDGSEFCTWSLKKKQKKKNVLPCDKKG